MNSSMWVEGKLDRKYRDRSVNYNRRMYNIFNDPVNERIARIRDILSGNYSVEGKKITKIEQRAKLASEEISKLKRDISRGEVDDIKRALRQVRDYISINIENNRYVQNRYGESEFIKYPALILSSVESEVYREFNEDLPEYRKDRSIRVEVGNKWGPLETAVAQGSGLSPMKERVKSKKDEFIYVGNPFVISTQTIREMKRQFQWVFNLFSSDPAPTREGRRRPTRMEKVEYDIRCAFGYSPNYSEARGLRKNEPSRFILPVIGRKIFSKIRSIGRSAVNSMTKL